MQHIYLYFSIFMLSLICFIESKMISEDIHIGNLQSYLQNSFKVKFPETNVDIDGGSITTNKGIPETNAPPGNGADGSASSTESPSCPVVKEEITRPCLENTKTCVQDFFKEHLSCLPFDKNDDNVLYFEKSLLEMPSFGVTVDCYQATGSGLTTGKIEDFIVDYIRDLIVLTVSYTNITLNATTHYTLYETGTLPKVFATTPSITYPSLKISTYFNGAKNPQLSNSYHFGELGSLPSFKIILCDTYKEDPAIVEVLTKFVNYPSVLVQEAFRSFAPYLQTKFINTNVCNYGAQKKISI